MPASAPGSSSVTKVGTAGSTRCSAWATRSPTPGARTAAAPRSSRWRASFAPTGCSCSHRATGSASATSHRGCRSGRRSSNARAAAASVYDWLPAAAWTERHHVDVAVVLLDAGGDGVETYAERLAYWPFTHEELSDDLQAAGLQLAMTTSHPEAERSLVAATRARAVASGDSS